MAAANGLTGCVCFTCPLTRLLNKKCIVTTSQKCFAGGGLPRLPASSPWSQTQPLSGSRQEVTNLRMREIRQLPEEIRHQHCDEIQSALLSQLLLDKISFSRDTNLGWERAVFLGVGRRRKQGKGVGGLGGEGRKRAGSGETQLFRVRLPGWAPARSINSFCRSLFPFMSE